MTRIEFVIEGDPPRKNQRHEIVAPRGCRPFLTNTEHFHNFLLRLTNRWRRAGSTKIRAGTWRITIAAFWSKRRRRDVDIAIGDVDAPVSAVLDALQQCGAIDDDVRFVELVAFKAYDKHNPRTVITIEPVDEGCVQLGLECAARRRVNLDLDEGEPNDGEG